MEKNKSIFSVDKLLCIGCGNCIAESKNNFKMDDNGYSVVKKQPDNDSEIELCNVALNNCPVKAITKS